MKLCLKYSRLFFSGHGVVVHNILTMNQLCTFVAENLDEPYRELLVWSVFFSRMPMAKFFWKQCPDQLGSALVACKMFKSLAGEARWEGKLQLAEELESNARLVSWLILL